MKGPRAETWTPPSAAAAATGAAGIALVLIGALAAEEDEPSWDRLLLLSAPGREPAEREQPEQEQSERDEAREP